MLALIFGFVAFVVIVFLRPIVPFPPLPGPDPCLGLHGEAKNICREFCVVQDCDVGDSLRPPCENLRADFARRTGVYFFPCELGRPPHRTEEPQPPTPTSIATATSTSTPEGTGRSGLLWAEPEGVIWAKGCRATETGWGARGTAWRRRCPRRQTSTLPDVTAATD